MGYTGVKFERKQIQGEKKLYKEKEEELIEACSFLAENGLAPKIEGGYAGNASFKVPEGIVITASGSNLGELFSKDLVMVPETSYEEFECNYLGETKPSSETILHSTIYEESPHSFGTKAILHGHYDPIVGNSQELGLPETENFQEYGSKELVDEVITLLHENLSKRFVAKDHGFFVLGESIQEAREKIKDLYQQSEKL